VCTSVIRDSDHHWLCVLYVFRTHHVLCFSPQAGNILENKYLLQCSNKLRHKLDKVRGKWRIFLAYDMGMFGSIKYSVRTEK